MTFKVTKVITSPPQIEKMYLKLHSEALPIGWGKVLEERGSLQVIGFHPVHG